MYQSEVSLTLNQSHDDVIIGMLQKMQGNTVLLIFLLIVIVAIYLLSLLLIFIRKFKLMFSTRQTRSYYVIIFIYIITKLILCTILLIEIISQIPNQWSNLSGEDVEIVLKNSILLADLAIVELFLVALYFYLKLCFGSCQRQPTGKIKKILFFTVRSMIIVVILAFFVPLVIFDFKQIDYEILNSIAAGFNGLVLVLFLVSFFYLNFKMTGLMLQQKLNAVIKKLYKVLCVILISRIIMLTIQIIIAFKIHDGSFESFVEFFEESNGQIIAFGICFVATILMTLLTQALPIMYSMRVSVIEAFSLCLSFRSKFSGQIIKQKLLNKESFEYQSQSQQDIQNMCLAQFNNLHQIKTKQNSIWQIKRGTIKNEDFIIKIAKHEISNYIIQDIENEIRKWTEIKLQHLNPIIFFKERQSVYIVQKFISFNLDTLVNRCQPQSKEVYLLGLELAKAIQELHKNGMTHGSLKPSYILIDVNQKLYITGLGLQSLKKYLSLITGYTNKSMYTSVELLSDKNNVIIKPSKESDIYSFGMIFYQMVTKNRLYREQSLKQCKQRFSDQKSRPKIQDNLDGRIKSLIRNCWQDESSKRPLISDVIITLKKVIDQY